MVQVPNQASRPAQRETSLRPVASAVPQYLQAEPFAYPARAVEDDGFVETMRRLRRRWFLIFTFTLVGAGIALLAVWTLPSYYVSEGRVLVGLQAPRVLNVEAIIADVSPDAERVQNEGFVLQSRNIAGQVIDKLGLRDDPEFNPALRKPSLWAKYTGMAATAAADIGAEARALLPEDIKAWLDSTMAGETTRPPAGAGTTQSRHNDRMIDFLLSRVDVSTLGRSHVLSVKAEAQNPETAARIANAFAEGYLEYQRRAKIESMDHVEKFLMGRIAELRQQVRKSDQAVEDYRRSHDLYKSAGSGVTAQQLSALNTQLMVEQTAKAEAESRLNEAQAMRQANLGGESVPEVLRSPLISALKQQLADAERRAAELSASYGTRHPSIAGVRAEIGNLQGRVNAEVAKIIDGLSREARTANARYEVLSKNFDQLKGTMGVVNDRSIQLEALERDATVNRTLLDAMLLRAKQTMGTEDILQANAKLVSPAAPSSATSYPPKLLIVILGILGGLMVGAAIALVREKGDDTFRRADQIEAITGLPVIAMVPQVGRRTPPAMEVLRQPTSAYSEALRRLHIGVELSADPGSPKTLLVSSATPSEGKSVIAASLARLIASNGRRVLLIDCDWRSPNLHRIFHCSNRMGLADLLSGETKDFEDILHRDAQSGVDVLPSGNWNPRSAHYLSSDRMRLLLEALVDHYDYIILDTPPALVAADVLSLSRIVDKVVFVVRWGHTRQEAALEALRQISDAQGNVAGVVMSRVLSKEYRQYAYGDPIREYARPRKAMAS